MSNNLWQSMFGASQAQAAPSPLKPVQPTQAFLAPIPLDNPLAMKARQEEAEKLIREQQEKAASQGMQFPVAPGAMPSGMSQSIGYSFPMKDADPELEQKFKELVAKREAGVGSMEQEMAERKQRDFSGLEHKDFSPILGLVDTWTGSNFKQGYKPSDAKLTNEAMIAKLGEHVNKEQGSIADDYLKLMQQQQNNSQVKAQMRMMAESARDRRFDQSKDLTKEDNIRKDVDKAASAFATRQEQFATMDSVVASGDGRSISMILSQIARSVGGEKGALSDGDVARVFPPDVATDLAGLQRYLSSQNTQISPSLQASITKLVDLAKTNATKYYGDSIERKRQFYSSPGSAYSDIMPTVGNHIFNEAKNMAAVPAQQGPPAGGGILSPLDWKKNRGQK